MSKVEVAGFSLSSFSPVFLGHGENLLSGINFPVLGFKLAERVATEEVTHIVLKKQ